MDEMSRRRFLGLGAVALGAVPFVGELLKKGPLEGPKVENTAAHEPLYGDLYDVEVEAVNPYSYGDRPEPPVELTRENMQKELEAMGKLKRPWLHLYNPDELAFRSPDGKWTYFGKGALKPLFLPGHPCDTVELEWVVDVWETMQKRVRAGDTISCMPDGPYFEFAKFANPA